MSMKQFEVIYLKDDVFEKGVNFREIISAHKEISKFAYILHHDGVERPHYHIFLRVEKTITTVNDVAKWFGVDVLFVHILKSHLTNILEFYLQKHFAHPHNKKYSVNDLITNIVPLPLKN